jgi:trimethylguanosine synthase
MAHTQTCEPLPDVSNDDTSVIVSTGRPRRIFSKRGIVRPPYNPELERYWYQRRELFTRYDRGIWLDLEGWYSVTPEAVAAACSTAMGAGARCQLFIDAFAGVGGNAIQQALHDPGGLIIAIDIDPHKVEIARHNAAIYGVAHRIEFVVGDFLQLAPRLRAHVCFLSPPWGGLIDYADASCFRLSTLGRSEWGLDGFDLLDLAVRVAPTVGYYLPIETDEAELHSLVARHDKRCTCELVHLLWGTGKKKRTRAILACFRLELPHVRIGLAGRAHDTAQKESRLYSLVQMAC